MCSSVVLGGFFWLAGWGDVGYIYFCIVSRYCRFSLEGAGGYSLGVVDFELRGLPPVLGERMKTLNPISHLVLSRSPDL